MALSCLLIYVRLPIILVFLPIIRLSIHHLRQGDKKWLMNLMRKRRILDMKWVLRLAIVLYLANIYERL